MPRIRERHRIAGSGKDKSKEELPEDEATLLLLKLKNRKTSHMTKLVWFVCSPHVCVGFPYNQKHVFQV